MNDTAQAPSQQVARRPTNFEIEMANYDPQFQAALPAHIPLDRFKRVVITAINQNPDLMKADRRSLFLSCVRAAQDGLFPDGREAALVLFGKNVTYLPMVAGIIKRMRNSGDVAAVDTQIVHEHDEFDYRLGDQPHINHKPTLGEPGKPIAAYAIIKLTNGEVLREVMSVAEIEKVRKVSRAANNGPWVSWWDMMARKTVLRRCSKRAPVSSDLDAMLQRDDEAALGSGRQGEAVVDTPPRPTRADARTPAPRGQVTDVEDESHQEEPIPFTVVDAQGEVREYAEPADAFAAMDKAIADAASRGEGPLEDLWRENATFLTTLRESNLGDLADKLNEAYGKAADGIKAKAREAASQAEAARKRQQAEADTKPEAPESQNAPAGAQGKPAEGQSAPATQQASAEPPEAQRAPAQRQQRAPTPMKSPLVTKRLSDWPSWVDWVIKLIGNTAPEALDGLHNTYKAEIEELQDFRTADHQRVIEAFDLRRAPPK